MNVPAERLIRVDLSPPTFIHVPQAPVVERRTLLSRGAGNEWHMTAVRGVTAAGEQAGLSNHTWSHLDAPFHLLADGATFDALDPRRYLALRTRVVDLTASPETRRASVNGVGYHTRIAVEDLPADLGRFDALLLVTGFSDLYQSGYPMTDGADQHYPHVDAEAARHIAAQARISVLAIDAPSVDKPATDAAAHRILLGRRPPVLLLESLTAVRLRRLRPLPAEVLMTAEPLRVYGPGQDGALSSVYAWAPVPGEEDFFRAFGDAVCGARHIRD